MSDQKPLFEKKQLNSSDSEKMVEYLSRSLILDERGAPNFAKMTIAITLLLTIAFFVWASVTPIKEMAYASGSVLPESLEHPVQHYEGGIVKEVLVTEGDRVKKGDILFKLDEIAFKADQNQLIIRNDTLKAQSERLRALINDREPDFLALNIVNSQIIEGEMNLFTAAKASFAVKLDLLNNQVEDKEQAYESVKERHHFFEDQLSSLQEEVKGLRHLYEKRIARKSTLLQREREMKSMEAEVALSSSRILTAKNSMNDAITKRNDFLKTKENEYRNELNKVTAQLAEINEQLKRYNDRVDRLVIKSPIDGIIKTLAITSKETVIQPGQVVASLIPSDMDVFAEIEILPRDIGHIHKDMAVYVKVDAFEFSRYGGIEGGIESISPSSFVKDNGQVYFKAKVKLQNIYLKDSELLQIKPGMTVIADIHTGEKTIMAYLARPIFEAFDTSFTER